MPAFDAVCSRRNPTNFEPPIVSLTAKTDSGQCRCTSSSSYGRRTSCIITSSFFGLNSYTKPARGWAILNPLALPESVHVVHEAVAVLNLIVCPTRATTTLEKYSLVLIDDHGLRRWGRLKDFLYSDEDIRQAAVNVATRFHTLASIRFRNIG